MGINIGKIEYKNINNQYTYDAAKSSPQNQQIDIEDIDYNEDYEAEAAYTSPEVETGLIQLGATGALFGMSVVEGGAMVVEAGVDLLLYATAAVVTPAAFLSDAASNVIADITHDESIRKSGSVDELWAGVSAATTPNVVQNTFDNLYKDESSFAYQIYNNAYAPELTRFAGNTLGECLTVGAAAGALGISESAIYSVTSGTNNISKYLAKGTDVPQAIALGVVEGGVTFGTYQLKGMAKGLNTVDKAAVKAAIGTGKDLADQTLNYMGDDSHEAKIYVNKALASGLKSGVATVAGDNIKMPENINGIVKDSLHYTATHTLGEASKKPVESVLDTTVTAKTTAGINDVI